MTLTNFPNLPDNFYKFLVTVGVLLLVYAYYEDIELTKKMHSEIDKYENKVQEANERLKRNKFRLEQIIEKANFLAVKNGVPEVITTKDSIVIFNQTLKGPENLKATSDSVAKMWDEYKIEEFEANIINDQLEYLTQRLEELDIIFESDQITNKLISILAALLITIGIFNWQRQQNINDKLQNHQLNQIPKEYEYCQSCGRNFSPIRGKGKNKDGTFNNTFCSECFDDGEFKESFTLHDFKVLKNEALKNATSRKKQSKIKHRLNNLARWNNNEYD